MTAPDGPEAPQAAGTVERKSGQVCVLWGVALALLAGLGIFCWLFVLPHLGTRRVVREFTGALDFARAEAPHGSKELATAADAALRTLGGRNSATVKLGAYVRLPGWLAPNKRSAYYLLGCCGESAVPVLTRALADDDWRARHCAAGALGHIGPSAAPSVPALRRLVGDPNLQVRARAAYALGRIGAEAREAVPELVNMLRRHEWPHNAYAAAALGGIGPDAKSAVPALVQVIRNTNTHPDAKGTAIKSLGRIGPAAAAAVPVLAEETASATGCRREAAQALGEIGSREGVPALIALLRSGDAALCYDAAKALGRIGAAAAEAVPELTVVSKREYDHTLAGEEASAALWRITGKPDEVLRLLASDDWRRRCFAACRLAELGPSVETAIPHLEKALGDKNERVRQASAEAMRKIKAAQEKDK